MIAEGWPLFAQVAPRAAEVITPLSLDPAPLVDALASTPSTLVHGNWKLDNLGTTPDGRTVLLDWETPGRGAALSDLGVVPRDQLPPAPHPKEEADRCVPRRRWRATASTPTGGGSGSSACA